MNETLINIGLAATQILFTFALGFYLITCLQWFSYKFERVLFHFTRPLWHVFFLIVPIVLFYGAERFFWIYFYFALVPSLTLWHKKLDKKLVFTPRVKRFFVILALAVIASYAVYLATQHRVNLGVVLPLVLSFALSFLLEKAKFKAYENSARKKLASMPELKIIMITASFGKTSLKNFLFELLEIDFVCR